jgi:polysaccharide deacetylase family protein (PEP-CTERM system associated)
MTLFESNADKSLRSGGGKLAAVAAQDAAIGSSIRNAMSVDVEDFFQVQAFASTIDRRDWDAQPSRVEANTDRVLALFDAAGVKATFFTLGWIAERHPALVRRIVAAGHELASHGYSHVPIFDQTPEAFRADLRRTKQLLEDIGGCSIKGYRAASFSINQKNLWALQILGEEGFSYSSSIYPVVHDFYGMPNASRHAFHPQNDAFLEIPMTTIVLLGQNFPCSGGGYFRLLPYPITRWALRRVNAADGWPCVFYFHPWEVDPDQPRPAGLPWKSRLRHYVNLRRMEARLTRLLADFAWDRMDHIFLEPQAEQIRQV